MTPCTMGVGCDEYGVCYASAHDHPEECPHYNEETQSMKTEPYMGGPITTPLLTGYEEMALSGDAVRIPKQRMFLDTEPEEIEPLNDKLNRLAREIHADNIAAGWWSDLATGESIVATRNRPEMLMLVVSELSEASEGVGQNDDKLPHLPQFDVELADAAIRLLDLIGAEGGTEFEEDGDDWCDAFRFHDVDTALMCIVNSVSAAMEHVRKGRQEDFVAVLGETLLLVLGLAAAYRIDLFAVIEAKRAFNATRADHQIANRLKSDGKKF